MPSSADVKVVVDLSYLQPHVFHLQIVRAEMLQFDLVPDLDIFRGVLIIPSDLHCNGGAGKCSSLRTFRSDNSPGRTGYLPPVIGKDDGKRSALFVSGLEGFLFRVLEIPDIVVSVWITSTRMVGVGIPGNFTIRKSGRIGKPNREGFGKNCRISGTDDLRLVGNFCIQRRDFLNDAS